jgi:hypothetical protein
VGVAFAAKAGEGAVERRLPGIGVGLEDLDVGAEDRQEELEELLLREDFRDPS